jgi:hypothetical protein
MSSGGLPAAEGSFREGRRGRAADVTLAGGVNRIGVAGNYRSRGTRGTRHAERLERKGPDEMQMKRIGMMLCLGWLLASTACSTDRITMLDPNQPQYGMTYADWAVTWWQWVYSQPGSQGAVFDPTGANCALLQDTTSPVFFLAGDVGGTVVRPDCAFPASKAIFFPILIGTADNAGVPVAQQETADQLQASAQQIADQIVTSSLEVSWDDRPLDDPTAGKEGPTEFSYAVPYGDNFWSAVGVPGVSGTIYPAFTDGYWVMLPPQPAGAHKLHWSGMISGSQPFNLDVTFDLTLQ